MRAIIFPYIVVIERLKNLCFRDWKVFCSVYHFIMESVVYFMSFYTKSLYALRPWKQIVRDSLESDSNLHLKFIILTSLGHYTLFEEKVGGTEIRKVNKSYSEYFKVLWTICSVIYFSNEAKGKIERVLVSSSFVWKITNIYRYLKHNTFFYLKKTLVWS